MTTVQDGISDLGSIAKLRGKATDFRPNHNNLRSKVSLEESSRLVSYTNDLDIAKVISSCHFCMQVISNFLVDSAVHGTSKTSVRCHCNIQFLGSFFVSSNLSLLVKGLSSVSQGSGSFKIFFSSGKFCS